MARGVVEGGLGAASDSAVVQAVEGWVHFEEVGLVAFEGLEVAIACVDLNGGRVDADGEDEAVIVDIGEFIRGLVAEVGGEVVVFVADVSVRGAGFIGEVIEGWMGENLIVLIFPIDSGSGDVGEGEVVEEDAIEEAGIDGIDKARGEDGEVGFVNLEGYEGGVSMEVAIIEVGFGEVVGEEVVGSDAEVAAPGVGGVVFGVEVEVDVFELIFGEHGQICSVTVGVLEHGVGYDHVLLFLVGIDYVAVLADAVVVEGAADARLGGGERAGEVDGGGG